MAHGDISTDTRQSHIDLFNQKQNSKAQYINAIVISPASVEGINLKGVRHVHIVEPQWS